MSHSSYLFQQAKQVTPGGVNSPARSFSGVNSDPVFIQSAQGAYLTDVDNKKYIDYVGSWGPMILGHSHPLVVEAINRQAQLGVSFGAPCELEIALAQKVCQLVSSINKVRFVNSGTEATMTAVRLARGATGRNKIIKFAGCYHGHVDSLLVAAGSGALTLASPDSPGVTAATAQDTLIADYNNLAQVAEQFQTYGDDIAGVIVEPMAGNMNFVRPDSDFLTGLRQLCDQHGAVLIFDEVMTGFRVALGGAQEHVQVHPDLTCLGKVIGGGLPVGAVGGRAELMDQLSPAGGVYQAGTLSGNPLAMAAGLATLNVISEPGFYSQLAAKTKRLVLGLNAAAEASNTAFFADGEGGMFGLFFHNSGPNHNLQDVQRANKEQFVRFFEHMLQAGVYLAPSMFEAGFMSQAHTEEDIDHTISLARKFFEQR